MTAVAIDLDPETFVSLCRSGGQGVREKPQ
jgi:hypothetical protein